MIIFIIMMLTILAFPLYWSLRLFAMMFLRPFRRPLRKLAWRVRNSDVPILEVTAIILEIIIAFLKAIAIMILAVEIWSYATGVKETQQRTDNVILHAVQIHPNPSTLRIEI